MRTRLDSEDPEMAAKLRAISPASLRAAARAIAALDDPRLVREMVRSAVTAGH